MKKISDIFDSECSLVGGGTMPEKDLIRSEAELLKLEHESGRYASDKNRNRALRTLRALREALRYKLDSAHPPACICADCEKARALLGEVER